MSQFCGSLAALSRRSLLTVILYWVFCACGCEAVSASDRCARKSCKGEGDKLPAMMVHHCSLPLRAPLVRAGALLYRQKREKLIRDAPPGQCRNRRDFLRG